MNGLRVTDGTTTVVLTAEVALVRHYVPKTPDKSRVEQARYARDGGEVPISTYQNVTEPVDVAWTDNTIARRDIAALNRLFLAARTVQARALGSRVYVEFSPDGSEDYYRSEILDGDVMLDDQALNWQYTSEVIHAQITWLRRYYWEGPEAQIPLKNSHDVGNTAGLQMESTQDSGHSNYAIVAGKYLAGDLPAPIRLEITNSYDSARRLAEVWVGHDCHEGVSATLDAWEGEDWPPAALYNHTIEGESADGVTPVADAACSAGARAEKTWSGGTETKLFSWTLYAPLLNATRGNWYRMVLRLGATFAYGDLWLRWKVMLGVTALWEGPQFLGRANQTLQDLGIAQLPAALAGETGMYPLTLALYGQRAAAESTLIVDAIHLIPMDGWRRLRPQGYNCAYTVTLVDDMPAGHVYTTGWEPDGKVANYQGMGRIELQPNLDQVLYFLQADDLGASPIARTASVKIFYRPRRVTL